MIHRLQFIELTLKYFRFVPRGTKLDFSFYNVPRGTKKNRVTFTCDSIFSFCLLVPFYKPYPKVLLCTGLL